MTDTQKYFVSTQLIRTAQMLEISQLLLTLLGKEAYLSLPSKKRLRTIAAAVTDGQNRLYNILKEESKEVANQVLTEETVVQICGVIDYMIQVGHEEREEILNEAYHVHASYIANVEQQARENAQTPNCS